MNSMQDALVKAGMLDENAISHDDRPIVKSGKGAVRQFMNASPNEPMFARITLMHENIETGQMETEWKGLVACTGVETVEIEENRYYSYKETRAKFRAIEDGERLHDIRYGYKPLKSVGFPGNSENFMIDEIVESTPELIAQYESVMDNITATVRWCDFDEVLDKYDMCHEVKGTEQSAVIQVRTLDDASIWMLENHPGQYMGHSVSMSNGDFSAHAVPCNQYPKGQFETRANRMLYAASEAKKFGCKLGIPDYSLVTQIESQQGIERTGIDLSNESVVSDEFDKEV